MLKAADAGTPDRCKSLAKSIWNQIKNTNMKHLIRSVKYFIYIAIIFCIIVAIIYYLSDHSNTNSPLDLFKEGSWWKMLLFFVAFSAVYPFVGYQKKEIYHNGNVKDYRKQILELFENARYQLVDEGDNYFKFRMKNRVSAVLTKMSEDEITIDFSENPAIISGLRKDVLRFARNVERVISVEE